MAGALSAAILFVFLFLVALGATTTTVRWFRYKAEGLSTPVLLPRDRDLLVGLAIPFVLIGLARIVPGLRESTMDANGETALWWLLVTGLPPIYAAARYDWFELFRIEK